MISAGAALAAAPDLLLGLAYLTAWIDPTLVPDWIAPYLLGILLLEFVIIHSSGCMIAMYSGPSSRAYRAISVLALGAGFALMAAIVAWRFDAHWMLLSFALLTLNKLLGVFFVPGADTDRSWAWSSWLAALSLYMLCMALAHLLPLPVLGATLEGGVYPAGIPRLEPWVAEPQRYLAWGFSYFTLLALSEATQFAWLDRAIQSVGNLIQPGWR